MGHPLAGRARFLRLNHPTDKERSSMQPSYNEIRQAFLAGFQSIDEGDSFYAGFNAFLESAGCERRDDISCTCADQGAHGHLPECRWVKA